MVLNSIQAIIEFISRLRARLIENLDKTFQDLNFWSSGDRDLYYSTICDIETVNVRKFEEILLENTLEVTQKLFQSSVDDLLASYLDFNFVVTEAMMSEYDNNQERRSIGYRVTSVLQDGLVSWQNSLSGENYNQFCLTLADYIGIALENVIFQCKFNQ